MTLFSASHLVQSHRARFVLTEKGVNVSIADTDISNLPEDLVNLSSSNCVPTLVDRDLILYDTSVLTEYIDERYPHPPLMPVDPVGRAGIRLGLYRIERDLYTQMLILEAGGSDAVDTARENLRESLLVTSEIFSEFPYFLSHEMTLADCALAPVLWRLSYYGIELSVAEAGPLLKYANAIFSRDSFQQSLTEDEREMRE